MPVSNNPNPLDDDSRRPDPKRQDEELSLPSVPGPAYHRILLDAYLRDCKNGVVEKHTLITSRREMTYEDRAVFARMELGYRLAFHHKLHQFGLGEKAHDLTVRILHPVVAVGKTRREHHLYVDVVTKDGRSWLLDFEAAGCFERGPAALHLSIVSSEDKRERAVVTRLFSVPAFQEAVDKLIATPYEKVVKNPRAFVAFGWILQAIATARTAEPNDKMSKSSSAPPRFELASLKDFMWSGGPNPATFECCVDNAYYVVQLKLHERTKQPTVYLEEDFF